MMKSRRLVVACLTPLAALAAPFRAADLTADARWFMHLDYDAARASVVGAKALGITDDRTCPVAEVRAFAEAVGLDLRRDLLAFTAYGNGQRGRAVGILRHAGDNLKVGEYLKSKGAEPDVVDGVPVLGFACGQSGCRLVIAFPRRGVIVAAMSAADAAGACAALDNTATVATLPAELAGVAGSSPIVLAAADMAACAAANPKARMPMPVRSGAMSVAEASGNLAVNAALTFANGEAAAAAVQMVEGARSMAETRRPELAAWMQTLGVSAQGAEVAMSWSAKSDAIVAEMDKARARWQEWRSRRGVDAGACPISGK